MNKKMLKGLAVAAVVAFLGWKYGDQVKEKISPSQPQA